MTPESATTTDHDQIRRFVEALDSTPAVAGATGSDDDLRIRFRDESSDDLDAIGADKFLPMAVPAASPISSSAGERGPATLDGQALATRGRSGLHRLAPRRPAAPAAPG
jgi:hypothetical protein